MKQLRADIAVIGGGPAGMAAALEAKRLGAREVILLERDNALGGILRQCIHDGFGIHRFGERLSGTEYAQRFIREMAGSGITLKLSTMALEITPDKIIYACNDTDGMLEITCQAIILAMGCRERTAGQILLGGDRPAGVLTAGAVQRYINMEGYLPGKTAVILGSGDIGLIMARRMTLEGIQVKGVYEVMDSPGGLTRNIVQCLEDFEIPLHLSATVTQVHGQKRVEAVTVARVDADRNPIPGTQERVPCDLLVLAVGLIPENELSLKAGIALDSRTRGPVLGPQGMTSLPGVFAAGNVERVYDLVDDVSQSGELAAAGAAAYLAGKLPAQPAPSPLPPPEKAPSKTAPSSPWQGRTPGPDGEKKAYTCIICPSSCRLLAWQEGGEIRVQGHGCKRGLLHGQREYANPTRMLTTTVAIQGGPLPRLPVISQGEIPKAKLADCLKVLYALILDAPIACGQVIAEDICGTGISILASSDMERNEESVQALQGI